MVDRVRRSYRTSSDGPASVAVANLFQLPVTEEFGISNSQFVISNSLVLGVGIFLSPFIFKKLVTGNFRLIYSIAVIVQLQVLFMMLVYF